MISGLRQRSVNPAGSRVHRQHRVQEQAEILAITGLAESALARRVGGEMQLGGVLDRQHVPSGHALPGLPAGCRQHLLRRHRRIGQKTAKLDRLVAVLGQPVHAQRAMALHRVQQCPAHTRQPPVPKPPKVCTDHANHTLCHVVPGIDSEVGRVGKSFRTCVTAVALWERSERVSAPGEGRATKSLACTFAAPSPAASRRPLPEGYRSRTSAE